MKEGHSKTLCLPKTYLDAHAEAMASSTDGFLSAYENLGIVLETVPGVKEAYQIETAQNVDDWIELWGADPFAIRNLREGMECNAAYEKKQGYYKKVELEVFQNVSSDVDPAEYKVELSCDTDSVSSTEIFCPPHNSLNVTLFSLATNAEVHTFTLTKDQLHCMDGDVIDVFFKSENITVITNVTDPLNATAEPIETTTYELQWDKDSCMEPWKHTL